VITSIEKVKTDKLMKQDVAVVWGGANHMGKNASPDDLKHITNFIQNRRHTSVLIMSGPHRCGLVTSSCINNERKVFNRKLHKKMKMLDHTEIIDINLNLEHIGLNMNAIGKERIVKRIVKNIIKTLTSQVTPLYCNMEGKTSQNLVSNLKLPTSGKLRKQPV
jgi:radical SAM superfamily enzyme with C-terminal helix-hairpin-helix motif